MAALYAGFKNLSNNEQIYYMHLWGITTAELADRYQLTVTQIRNSFGYIKHKKKRFLKMKYRNIFSYTTIAVSAILDAISKAADGVFTVAEMVDVVEKTAQQIVPGTVHIEAVITPAEFKNATFNEGDIAMIIPAELTKKLKISFKVD